MIKKLKNGQKKLIPEMRGKKLTKLEGNMDMTNNGMTKGE